MHIILISFAVGVVITILFLILSVSAMFLVSGDGSAPAFTYFMLQLIDIPRQLFGMPSEGALLPASVFWGSIAGSSTLAIRFLAIVLDGPQDPVDKRGSSKPKK